MQKLLVAIVIGAITAVGAFGTTGALGKEKASPCYAPEAKDYPGDAASAGDLAKWMAAAATRAGLPAELPVMAALVDSGLRNLPAGAGDADSVGFFQMRASIWNRGEYEGYPDHPELQVKWFIDHAIAVKTTRFAAGVPTDEASYGEWIADVERPAEQYRGRYQLRLEEARALIFVK